LHCDGVPAAELADRFGTPLYVYSAGLLAQRYRRIRDAFAAWDVLPLANSLEKLSTPT